MKKFSFPFLLSLLLLQPLIGNEGLMLKRISEFWKDQAFDQVKTQILHFLSEYPGSNYCDNLHAMLGDLYLQEKAYEEALKSYDQIANQELQSKIESNYLQALFEMDDFRGILKKANKKSSDPKVHYLAGEASFRLGRQAPDPETQKALYIQAASHYATLATSGYANDVLWPLAEIYKTLGESAKAASIYFELAQKNPEQKEILLFQAAYLQSNFDKRKAADTFALIYKEGGKNSKNAAYNHLKILFELADYKNFISSYESMQKQLPQDKIDSLQFYIAKSLFELGDIERAAASLERCEGKSSYLLLAACAEKLEDIHLLEKATQKLSQAFPNDSDTAKAHLISAQISIDKGDTLRAQNNLEYVLKHFPDYSGREKLLCDYATLLARNTLWEESRCAFQTFLEAYPESSYKNQAWRQLLNAALKEGKRDLFTELLGKALSSSDAFSKEERQNYHLLWIKLLQEQESSQVSKELISFLDAYPNSAEGHLFAAIFYEQDSDVFKVHAERALKLDPYLKDSEQLHLKLFNIYIQIPEEERAAEHLYHCIANSSLEIKEENIHWLANYYFNKKQHLSSRKKALYLYEKIASHPFSPFNEKELLRYAELLHTEGKIEEKSSLLENLIETQQAQTNLPWKLHRQTLFELAKTYIEQKKDEKALSVYNLLINTSTHMPSYFSRAAQLERAKLQYALLNPEQKIKDSPEISLILNDLKDLQFKKKLHSEPLHLEAALEYIRIMTALAPEEEKVKRSLFLLKRAKEDFSSQADIHAKEYQAQRSVLPDKASILETYLSYIEGEILRLEEKTKRAEKIYQKLQEKNLDPALQKRVNTSMEILYDAR